LIHLLKHGAPLKGYTMKKCAAKADKSLLSKAKKVIKK